MANNRLNLIKMKKLVEARIIEYQGVHIYKAVLSRCIADLCDGDNAFSNRHQIEHYSKILMYIGKNY